MKSGLFSRSFVVIGAGPYGLATAAHLRAAGMEVRIFGKAMDFWHSHMPRGMLLRSPHDGSDIADPQKAFTLQRYAAAQAFELPRRVPLEDFVRYGQWFQREVLPDLDERSVTSVVRLGDTYRLTLSDGESFDTDNVIIAAGIGSFANYPTPFAGLPLDLVSHTSEGVNRDLGRFEGKRVVVIGGGQSAIESAAILNESGADVEVLVRQPQVRWLRNDTAVNWFNEKLNPFKAPGKIGPLGLDWLIEHPRLFTLMPRGLQDRLAYRAIRPAASGWLRPRMEKVPIRTGLGVESAHVEQGKVRLSLSDGSERRVDHVLLGTGYKISVGRYSFLADDLKCALRTVKGHPVLDAGFESSVPGLYFVGAPAAYSFGPLCRFVVGTRFTAGTLARHAVRKPALRRSLVRG